MCGIVGCISDTNAVPAVLFGLKKVEYRGYDSAGIAAVNSRGIEIRKGAGKVSDVIRRYNVSGIESRIVLGHTRWATHGGVSDMNAHPHESCKREVVVVHNGIIENYSELKDELIKKGHVFQSETDTEVIAHLIEENLKRNKSSLSATCRALRRLKGQYAIAAIFRDEPDKIIAARKDAPMIIGLGNGRNFVSSDVLAFIKYTDKAIFLDNNELAVVRKDSVNVYRVSDCAEVSKSHTQLAWELSSASKNRFAHYTLKEIHEQVNTVKSAMLQDPEKIRYFAEAIINSKHVFVTGAGTSYHAALLLSQRLRNEARIMAEAFLAGEYKQEAGLFGKDTLLIAMSQSGETADVLEAVREAKKKGARVLAIVNSIGSSLCRESEEFISINCGPEIGVAATKSFTSQIIVSNMIVSSITNKETVEQELLSESVRKSIGQEERVIEIAKAFSMKNDFYFIARGKNFPVALEGALKLKELSYVHAEGMPASELKHGTLALIEEGTPVVVINPSGSDYNDTISNVMEIRARGGRIIAVSDVHNKNYDYLVEIPRINEEYMPVLEVVPLQLLAYYMALERKNNPDYPRNLAKSVTVK